MYTYNNHVGFIKKENFMFLILVGIICKQLIGTNFKIHRWTILNIEDGNCNLLQIFWTMFRNEKYVKIRLSA